MELLLLHLHIRRIRKERGEERGRGRGVEWSWRGMGEEVMKGKRIIGEEGGGMREDTRYTQTERQRDRPERTYLLLV